MLLTRTDTYDILIWYVAETLWFVATELEANVLPAKIVPAPVVDVLKRPMFEMFAVAVTNESAELNAAVNCAVRDETTEVETALRALDACVSSPLSEVPFDAG